MISHPVPRVSPNAHIPHSARHHSVCERSPMAKPRHAIRVDRIGHAAFASTQAINLLAFERAIRRPGVTADEICREWALARWPDSPDEMAAIMQRGDEMVRKAH